MIHLIVLLYLIDDNLQRKKQNVSEEAIVKQSHFSKQYLLLCQLFLLLQMHMLLIRDTFLYWNAQLANESTIDQAFNGDICFFIDINSLFEWFIDLLFHVLKVNPCYLQWVEMFIHYFYSFNIVDFAGLFTFNFEIILCYSVFSSWNCVR